MPCSSWLGSASSPSGTGYLAGGAFGQFPQGLLVYQEANYPIFHVVAEGLLGVAALVAGLGLWRGSRWGRALALLALGVLGYSAVNSSGWPLKNDPALLIPMAATLVLVVRAFPYLLRRPSPYSEVRSTAHTSICRFAGDFGRDAVETNSGSALPPRPASRWRCSLLWSTDTASTHW